MGLPEQDNDPFIIWFNGRLTLNVDGILGHLFFTSGPARQLVEHYTLRVARVAPHIFWETVAEMWTQLRGYSSFSVLLHLQKKGRNSHLVTYKDVTDIYISTG